MSDSRTWFEDAYNLLAEHYHPSHHKVLQAGNDLINILILLEEYYDAERYARICYECLTKPVDTQSEEVRRAAEFLSRVTLKLIEKDVDDKGHDIVEVEMLAN